MIPLKYFLLLFFLFSVVPEMEAQHSRKQYTNLLEPNSTLITAGVNYTVEKINELEYIIKRFFPENKQITHFTTFNSENYNTRHGLTYEKYDDGTLLAQGLFVDNLKEGQWIEGVTQSGNYKDGLRQGKWITLDDKNRLLNEKQFMDGELDGKMIVYDTLGGIRSETIYKVGIILSTTEDTTDYKALPRFSGCETLELTDEERKKCAEKALLTFVYNRIKYPRRAIEEGLEGQALIQFVIEKDGSIGDIKPLRGLSKEIKAECLRLLDSMPVWIPGTQDGNPVRVRYTLPIQFKLK